MSGGQLAWGQHIVQAEEELGERKRLTGCTCREGRARPLQAWAAWRTLNPQ